LLFLQHDVAEKLGQNGLVSRHFGVAREVIDIDDEVAVAVSSVPYDVEIEEVQLEGASEAPGDVDDEGIWGHLGVIQMHQPVIPIVVVFSVVVGQVGDLRKRHKVLRNAHLLLLRHIREGLALDAPHVLAHHVNLEDHAAVVDELLQHDRGLQLVEHVAREHKRHLMRLGAAVGHKRLRNHRKLEALPSLGVH